MTVELGGGDTGNVGDVVGVGDRNPGEGFAPEETPPALDEVEPGGAHRNEGMLDPRVLGQPVGDWAAQMAGEVIGDEVEIALGIGPVKGLQESEVASRVAGGRGLGEDLPIAHAQRSIDPHLLQPALIIQGHLDPLAVG